MPQQKVPHVHAELIKQWADGAEIQYFSAFAQEWQNYPSTCTPIWLPEWQYRVKPEPKPDVVVYGCVERADFSNGNPRAKVFCCFADEKQIGIDTVRFIFDGETGKLKDAQVLANV